MARKIDLLERAYQKFNITEKGDTMKSISFTDEEVIVSLLAGETLAQIAEELGVTVSAVNARIDRMIKKARLIAA